MGSHTLVTGANGFIGRALCAELKRRGHSVLCVGRSMQRMEGLPGDARVVGDISAETDWSVVLDGVERVIHLAARVHVMRETTVDPLSAFRVVNVAGTERLARDAAMRGVRRFVYVSSVGVNGNHTESQPFSEKSVPSPYSAYTHSKLEAERVLFDISNKTGMEVTVVRPPLVYGPNTPGNFLRLLKLVARGVVLPLASVVNRRSMIYIGNVVDSLAVCAVHPEAAGKTYLVSDGEDISTAELIRRIAAAMGSKAHLFRMPQPVLRGLGKLAGKSEEVSRLVDSLVVNSSKIRAELGWQPPYSLDEGLCATVDWYQQHKTAIQ